MFEGISQFMPFWYHFTNVNEEETQQILLAICMITKWMCFILAKKQCLYQLFWTVFFLQYVVFLTSTYFIYHNAGHSWGFEFFCCWRWILLWNPFNKVFKGWPWTCCRKQQWVNMYLWSLSKQSDRANSCSCGMKVKCTLSFVASITCPYNVRNTVWW